MPQISISIPHEIHELLSQLAKKQKKSLSKITADLIQAGLLTQNQEEFLNFFVPQISSSHDKKKQEQVNFNDKLPEYWMTTLITTLMTTADILRCVYDPQKSKFNRKSVEEEIEALKENARNFIESRKQTTDNERTD